MTKFWKQTGRKQIIFCVYLFFFTARSLEWKVWQKTLVRCICKSTWTAAFRVENGCLSWVPVALRSTALDFCLVAILRKLGNNEQEQETVDSERPLHGMEATAFHRSHGLLTNSQGCQGGVRVGSAGRTLCHGSSTTWLQNGNCEMSMAAMSMAKQISFPQFGFSWVWHPLP